MEPISCPQYANYGRIYRVRQQIPDAQNFSSKETSKNRFKTYK